MSSPATTEEMAYRPDLLTPMHLIQDPGDPDWDAVWRRHQRNAMQDATCAACDRPILRRRGHTTAVCSADCRRVLRGMVRGLIAAGRREGKSIPYSRRTI